MRRPRQVEDRRSKIGSLANEAAAFVPIAGHPPFFLRPIYSPLSLFEDATLVQNISAQAYIPAYQAVIGAVPKPAFEDYSDRIREGNVWVAEMLRFTKPVDLYKSGRGHIRAELERFSWTWRSR